MSYGTVFPLWRDAAGRAWSAYTEHAFVQALGDGTLPPKAFLHYLVQDYIFLIHFSRAWALAVTKAETIEEMRSCAGTVNVLINDEIALHVSICGAHGIGEADLRVADERHANLAYTRYVLDAGHSGDLVDLLASLAPCVMGYGEIGLRLAQVATSGRYREWISTYAGAEYQATCHNVGALIDSAVNLRLGDQPKSSPRWGALCSRFRTATRLEGDFWQMGLDP